MTVDNESRKVSYDIDATSVFTFSFLFDIISESTVYVSFFDSDGEEVSVSMTRTNSSSPDANEYYVDKTNSRVVIGDGGDTYFQDQYGTSIKQIVIYREVELTQGEALPFATNLQTDAIETQFDKTMLAIQQVQEDVNRSLKLPIQDDSVESDLPAEASRANMFLGFDSDGKPVATAGTVDDMSIAFAVEHNSTTGIHGDLTTKGPWHDVKAYGAEGDDSTDDTTAIQLAVDSMPATGGILFFPYGVYKITAPIETEDRSLYIVGACSTCIHTDSPVQIKNYGNTDAFLINPSAAGRRTIIENMDIIDGHGSRTTGDGVHAERTDGGGVSVDLRNVKVSGHYNGIYVIRGVLSRLINCVCYQNDNNGFHIASSATGSGTSMTFDSCWAYDNTADGYYIDGYSYSRWVNCQADDNVNAYHVIKDGGGGNPNSLTFIGCGAEGNSNVGILLTDSDSISGISIIGGQLYNCGSDGIQTNDAQNVTIQSMKFVTNGGYGVNVEDNANPARTGDVVLINNNYVSNVSGEVKDANLIAMRIADSNQPNLYVPKNSSVGLGADSNRVQFYAGSLAFMTSSSTNNKGVASASADDFKILNDLPDGQSLNFKGSVDPDFTVLNAASYHDFTNEIPAGSLVLGVTVEIGTTLTGCTSFDVGIAGSDLDAWGDNITDLTEGSTTDISDFTINSPLYFPSATTIRITANGGNFTAGSMKLTLHYITITPAS